MNADTRKQIHEGRLDTLRSTLYEELTIPWIQILERNLFFFPLVLVRLVTAYEERNMAPYYRLCDFVLQEEETLHELFNARSWRYNDDSCLAEYTPKGYLVNQECVLSVGLLSTLMFVSSSHIDKVIGNCHYRILDSVMAGSTEIFDRCSPLRYLQCVPPVYLNECDGCYCFVLQESDAFCSCDHYLQRRVEDRYLLCVLCLMLHICVKYHCKWYAAWNDHASAELLFLTREKLL